MTTAIRTLFRGIALSATLFVLIGASYTSARADEVTVSGSTTGIVSGVSQLTFTGNAGFTGTTALNIGSLSGSNSLGSFFLSTAPTQALAGSFILNVTFTSPLGITGGQGTTYTAVILGTVSPNLDQGGVNIDFDNTPQTFSFTNGQNNGTFSLRVADLFVESGRSAQITAGITGEQAPAVPEPATLLLLGSGITGIAVKLRRRKKNQSSAPAE